MSYGLQITGNDAGGNFTVADTDLSMVNLIVTDVGRGSSFNLPGGFRPGDYIFVRRPSAPGGGGYTPVQQETGSGGFVQFDRPFVYSIESEINGDISFVGTAWEWVASTHVYGRRNLYIYTDFEVEMDYFVARKASTVMDLGLNVDDTYGIQLLTESGEIALDSRSFTSDKTFYIESYLPPESNFRELGTQSSSLSYSSGCYVNLEWTRKPTAGSGIAPVIGATVSGLYITDTSSYTIDGNFMSEGQGGEPILQLWSGHNAIFAARLGEGISSGGSPNESDGTGGNIDGPDTEPDEITGTIDYVSGSSVTEGNSISFNVATSEVSNFHTRVFKVVGTTANNDFVSVTHPFNADSQTITLSTYDTGSGSQTFDKTYSSGYTGTYARNRVSSYTGGAESSYSRDFTGNFIGNYSNAVSYQTDFSDTYNRTVDYTRTISRNEGFSSQYTRTRTTWSSAVSSYSRTVTYGGNFVGNYAGTYSRTRLQTLYYSRSFSNNVSYVGNYMVSNVFYEGSDAVKVPLMFSSIYTRVRTSSFAGTYTRNSSNTLSYVGDYARTSARLRYSSYAGAYSRTRVSSYVRNRGVSSTRTDSYTGYYSRSFVGNYSRVAGYSRTTQQNFSGNYVGQLDYIRYSTVIYLGNYVRNVASTNTFSRSFANTTPYARNFAGTYTRTVPAAPSSRWQYYANSYVGNYANTNTYSRNFVGNYVSNYSRTESFSRSVSAYTYQANPKYYWVEAPEDQNDRFSMIRQVDVFWDGARVATTTFPSFAPISYISEGGIFWHKGNLSNTVGDVTFYSVGQSSSTSAPSGSSSSSYTRSVPYSRTSTRTLSMSYAAGGAYSRTRVSTFARLVTYTGTNTLYYVGNYARNYVSGATRTDSYVGNFLSAVAYTRSRPAYFIGNFTGLAQEVIGGEPTPIISTRNRVSSYSGTYTRNVSYSRTRVASYAGAYSRTLNYSANYVGNYSRNIVDSYSGAYSQSFTGNYIGNYSRTVAQGVSYTGNYAGTGTQSFTGNYTRFATSISTRTRISTVTRNSNYTRTSPYIGEYAGYYTRTSTRGRSSILNYTRGLYYIGNYTGEYSRTVNSGFTRNSTYSRTVSYEGNYTGDFVGTTDNTLEFTRNRTSSYTRSVGTNSTRNISSSFVGTYIGNYTGTSTRTPTNTSEVGWQGERFVIELRRGSDTTSMAAAQGTLDVLDSKEFTLLDNDAGTFVSMSPQVLHHTATQHELEFDFYTEGNSVVAARLYRGSSIIVNSFNLLSNQKNTLTVNEVPPEDSTYTYTLQVFNGTDWILGTYYQVTKVSSVDQTPPSGGDSDGGDVPNTTPPGNIEN